jgi:2-polyprenyl-3-methyl-5-hydroxy-6-metoxy-1,4-benzoquinol methylase
VGYVVAIDRDAPSIDRARHRAHAGGVEFVTGDFLDYQLPTDSFDLVASIAVLHHVEMETALRRMRELVRPGGTLAVVGLARSQLPVDFLFDAAGAIVHRIHRLTKPYTEQTSPTVWPPPLTYRQVRQVAQRLLPGVRYRRRVLWRYSLIWDKPLN